ncbi:DUF1330 domain-containing protein [Elioraea sp.]|uniref:DUF1330 domain-containing protein n=1 Tax=Elioraea sp. TaxID=2185103 RepID=UPI0025BAC5DB|nr:DUF1330 domain-containing protein [Elioraea sp.]
MPAYLIANVRVKDAAKFEEYRALVPAVIAAHGGRYLVRGGAMTPKEGTPPHRVVILEFPTMDAAQQFYDSDDYAPLLKLRLEAADSDVTLVDGVAPPA